MIALEEMLVPPAKEAGIEVPKNPRKYNRSKYPHWALFCNVQLGSPMPQPSSHWHNAKVIRRMRLKTVLRKDLTFRDLIKRGFEIGYSK